MLYGLIIYLNDGSATREHFELQNPPKAVIKSAAQDKDLVVYPTLGQAGGVREGSVKEIKDLHQPSMPSQPKVIRAFSSRTVFNQSLKN